jgi:acyl-CoA thioester hydrolase
LLSGVIAQLLGDDVAVESTRGRGSSIAPRSVVTGDLRKVGLGDDGLDGFAGKCAWSPARETRAGEDEPPRIDSWHVRCFASLPAVRDRNARATGLSEMRGVPRSLDPMTDKDSQSIDPLAGYPVVITLPVLWGDQDAFQHVNNTVYLRWFESARIVYSELIGLTDLMKAEQIGPILASITCHYRLPITYPDMVLIGARVSRVGRTSLTMDHVILSESASLVAAEGTSTLVVYNYKDARPHPVPDPIRKAIEALEARAS